MEEGKVLVSDESGKVTNSEITSDTLAYLSRLEGNIQEWLEDFATEISTKQNLLNITPNSIPDLDSFWEGLTWYNADQNPAGEKPFEHYGFVLAFTTGANHIQIGIPHGGAVNENLRIRTYANKRWYGWKSISRRHVEFQATANIGNITHQNCFINLETSEVFIFVAMNGITGTITPGTAFCTIPTGFLPVKNAYGTASARISGGMITSCGMVDTSGAIRQLISSSTSTLDIFTFSCTYYISET